MFEEETDRQTDPQTDEKYRVCTVTVHLVYHLFMNKAFTFSFFRFFPHFLSPVLLLWQLRPSCPPLSPPLVALILFLYLLPFFSFPALQ